MSRFNYMQKIKKISAAIGITMLGFFVMWWLIRDSQTVFGGSAQPDGQSILVIAYGYAVTLVGVFLGSAYRKLQDMKTRPRPLIHIGKIRKFLSSVFRSIDFWMGLCGSPIVYALIWKSMGGGSVAGLTTIALQNGFFCTLILNGLYKNNVSRS